MSQTDPKSKKLINVPRFRDTLEFLNKNESWYIEQFKYKKELEYK